MGLAWRAAFGAGVVAAGVLGLGLSAAWAGKVPVKSPAPVPRPDRLVMAKANPAEKIPPVPLRQSGEVGYMVVDLDSGQVLAEREADHPFAPASTAKLPTAIYALDRLGPDFTFTTKVVTDGKISGDTLAGNLYLVGGGDPELDSDALEPLVEQLTKQGLRRIKGQFVTDGSVIPRVPAIDGTQPVDAAYDPSISGLNLNFNRVRLKWDARGKTKLLRVSAKSDRLDADVQAVKVSLDNVPNAPVFSYQAKGKAEVWRMADYAFKGRGARWLPVRNPALYAGDVFRGLAAAQGLTLTEPERGVAPKACRMIASVQGRPLRTVLKYMLRYSTNLTAEMVGMAATRSTGAAPQTMADSAAAMNAWAAGFAHFPPGDPGFRLVNHSGLSQDSRVSPRRMVQVLLAAARRHPEPGARYPHLPGGVVELLKHVNIAAKAVDMDYRHIEIAAKTGTMDYVSGLAGYIATPSGRRLAFAIYSNDLNRRPDGPDRRSNRTWIARAKIYERALIRSWILKLDG